MDRTDCRLVRTDAVALSSGVADIDDVLGNFVVGVSFGVLATGRGGTKTSEKLRSEERSSPTRETT